MAPSTGQWLQVRVWDAPTKGLLWLVSSSLFRRGPLCRSWQRGLQRKSRSTRHDLCNRKRVELFGTRDRASSREIYPISSGLVLMMDTRAQHKFPHTWIISVSIKKHQAHISRRDGTFRVSSINTRRHEIWEKITTDQNPNWSHFGMLVGGYSGVTLNVARPDMNNYATSGVMLY
jgi:hypothetical protein